MVERHLTPQDIHDRYHVLNGAIYGLASHGRFIGAFKPGNRSRHVRGLYLAGGAAHPGPGHADGDDVRLDRRRRARRGHQGREPAEGVLTREPASARPGRSGSAQGRTVSGRAPLRRAPPLHGPARSAAIFARHLNALRVAALGRTGAAAGCGPVVVYSNHPAWWDARRLSSWPPTASSRAARATRRSMPRC